MAVSDNTHHFLEEPSFFVESKTTSKISVYKHLVLASFDGGGIASLVASTVVMQRVEEMMHLAGESNFHWHELFHMLGGTGVGGLLALLLGRLRIPVGDILKFFDDLRLSAESKASPEPTTRWGWLRKLFGKAPNDRQFEDELIRFIKSHPSTNPDETNSDIIREVLYDERADSLPVFIMVPSKTRRQLLYQVRDVRILRSYRTPMIKENRAETVTDAVVATFKSRPFRGPEVKFFDHLDEDGIVAYNNPTKLLVEDAQVLYGYGPQFTLLLSIGATLGAKEMPQSRSRRDQDFAALLHHASSRTHNLVADMFEKYKLGTYVRMNVPGLHHFGLDDYAAIPEIIEKTKEFLDTDVGKMLLNAVTDALLSAIARASMDSTVEAVPSFIAKSTSNGTTAVEANANDPHSSPSPSVIH